MKKPGIARLFIGLRWMLMLLVARHIVFTQDLLQRRDQCPQPEANQQNAGNAPGAAALQ
jgi:hypothetical protein